MRATARFANSVPAKTGSPGRDGFRVFAKAALILLFALFLFDVMGAIIKLLGNRYPPEQLSALRNFFGLIPSFVLIVSSREWHAAGRRVVIRQWRLGLARGIFIAFAQICFYTSLVHLEFATASTIGFATPLFITALTLPVLGNRVGLWRWLAVLVGFAGIVWVVRPGSDVFSWYALLPLAASMGYASAAVLVRLFDSDVPSTMINLYTTVGALVGSLVLVFSLGNLTPVLSAADWLWILAMGLCGGVAVISLISAYRLTVPSNLSPFEYFGIVFSFALGWVFFGEAPFGRLIPGVFLIVAGGLMIVWRENADRLRRDAGLAEEPPA
ncbi:MAG: DMT family transporter [Paracoccaceae bacterium]